MALLLLAAACGKNDATTREDHHSELRADLEAHSALVRCEAAARLWNATRQFDPGLKLLLEHVGSDDAQSRRAAVRYLPKADRIPKSRIDALAKLPRREALFALGAVGRQAGAHAGMARAALDDSAVVVGAVAAWALFRMTGDPDTPIRKLLARLAGLDLSEGQMAVRALIADRILSIAKQQPQPLIDALEEKRHAAAARELLALIRSKDAPGYAAAQAALAR